MFLSIRAANRSLALILTGMLTAAACTEAGETFQTPASQSYTLPAEALLGGEIEGPHLAPPSELPSFEIDSERTAFLIPFEGVSLISSTHGDDRLRRWIDLFPSNTYGLLQPRVVLSHFGIHSDPKIEALAMEYSYDYPDREGDRGSVLSTFLEVCLLKKERSTGACQRVDVWQAEVPEAEQEESFMRTNSFRDGGKPGRPCIACPLLRDHDGDGYRDLVLWRRCGPGPPRAGAEAVPKTEELLWMKFIPETGRFRRAIRLEGLAPESEACWAGRVSMPP